MEIYLKSQKKKIKIASQDFNIKYPCNFWLLTKRNYKKKTKIYTSNKIGDSLKKKLIYKVEDYKLCTMTSISQAKIYALLPTNIIVIIIITLHAHILCMDLKKN